MNLLNNPNYRGLGWAQLRWMFTAVMLGHYIPLTWVTFGLDYLLWGMNPFGYHLANLLLHSANAGVFYFVALRLLRLAVRGTGEVALRLGAAIAALFFALHPLRVESVAWVTERKDVLSGLFFLLTILTYLKACEVKAPRRWRWLAASVGCYALALASKSIVMTLPVLLILLDVYPLRRLGGDWREWIAPGARRVWVEKIPYLLLAIAGAGMALYAVWTTLTPIERYSLATRPAIALYSLWFYVWKTLFPLGLSPMYELPVRVSLLDPPFLLSAIAVGAITIGLFLLRRTWPAGLAAWVYYVVSLAPVIGIVHVGFQLANDRYSYLSCLGWALLLGWGVCAVGRAWQSGTLRPAFVRLATAGAAVWLIGLAALTWQQIPVWRNAVTLWEYALHFDPDCALCHHNLGARLLARGRAELAVEHLQRAYTLRPERVGTYYALGVALFDVGRQAEAIAHFQRFLERYPDHTDAQSRLGLALLHAGRPAEAIAHFQRLIERHPDPETKSRLGLALLQAGRPAEAIPYLRAALSRRPADADVQNHLGIALMLQGEGGAGITHLRRAIQLDPSHLEAYTNLGIALNSVGNPAEAITHFQRALKLNPKAPQPRRGLARAYLALGQIDRARAEYEVLKRLDGNVARLLSPMLGP